MAGREIAVKKYVVRLSAEERERLEAMTCAGEHPAQLLTKARILLKADVSEAGEVVGDAPGSRRGFAGKARLRRPCRHCDGGLIFLIEFLSQG